MPARSIQVTIDPYVAHRCAILSNCHSASHLLHVLIRRTNAQLVGKLTPDEVDAMAAIASGCYEFTQIAQALNWDVQRPIKNKKPNQRQRRWQRLERMLAYLVEADHLEVVSKGGGDGVKRGAPAIRYYVPVGAALGSDFEIARPRGARDEPDDDD